MITGRKTYILRNDNFAYATAAEAAAELSVDPMRISAHLRDPVRYPDVNGYTFKRVPTDPKNYVGKGTLL